MQPKLHGLEISYVEVGYNAAVLERDGFLDDENTLEVEWVVQPVDQSVDQSVVQSVVQNMTALYENRLHHELKVRHRHLWDVDDVEMSMNPDWKEMEMVQHDPYSVLE